MSLAPLSRLTLYFGIASIVRLIVCSAGLLLAWDQLMGPTVWIWMGLRWLAGILGPILVGLSWCGEFLSIEIHSPQLVFFSSPSF